MRQKELPVVGEGDPIDRPADGTGQPQIEHTAAQPGPALVWEGSLLSPGGGHGHDRQQQYVPDPHRQNRLSTLHPLAGAAARSAPPVSH